MRRVVYTKILEAWMTYVLEKREGLKEREWEREGGRKRGLVCEWVREREREREREKGSLNVKVKRYKSIVFGWNCSLADPNVSVQK